VRAPKPIVGRRRNVRLLQSNDWIDVGFLA
jgi:hypothetical protein